MNDRVFVIAEAGVNHNGSLDLALGLVDAAADAGADAVKFQTFSAEALCSPSARKATYQERATGARESQFQMLKRLELDRVAHERLQARAQERGLEFLSSPFDEASADLLESLGVRRYKLGSGELTNVPLLLHVAAKQRPLIVSTGMASMEEVADAVATLRGAGVLDLSLLHCVTEYPAPANQANLRAIGALHERFGVPVGYSDHATGFDLAIAAVAMGAVILEKHLTLDRSLPGPDQAASLEPPELRQMVMAVRRVAAALGDGVKRPMPCELPNIEVARKSVVAARLIPRGTVIERADLAVKRPGHGIRPADLAKIVGRRARRDFAPHEVLAWEAIE